MSIRQHFSDFFRVGLDVLSTFQDSTTNVTLVNLGDSSSGYRDSDQADIWNATQGVMCQPAAPTAGSPSCQTIVLSGGNRDSVIAMRDVRSAGTYGTLSPGDSVLFATGQGYSRVYCRQNGQVQITTNEGNTSGGTSTTITVATDGTITIDAPTEVKVGPNAASVAIAGGSDHVSLAGVTDTNIRAIVASAITAAGDASAEPGFLAFVAALQVAFAGAGNIPPSTAALKTKAT